MTALELERLARSVVQPSGTTGAVAVVDHTPGGRLSKPLDAYPSGIGGRTRFGAAWLVGGMVVHPRPIATFDRQSDALRLVGLINGTASTSRPAPRMPVSEEPPEVPKRVGPPLLPVAATNSVAVESEPADVCAGCGNPLPPGRHGQRRRTCSPACRQRARRRPAAERVSGDADSGSVLSHLPRPSGAAGRSTLPDPPSPVAVGASSSARPPLRRTAHPADRSGGDRGDVQLPLLSG